MHYPLFYKGAHNYIFCMARKNYVQKSLSTYNQITEPPTLLSDNIPISELVKFNVWWKTGEFFPNDQDIEHWTASKFKWDFRINKTIEDFDVIYVLRGPRRVGKTTLLKLRIKKQLADGIIRDNIFYFSCNSLFNKPFKGEQDLAPVLDTYLTKVKKPGERAFLYIDEVSMIKDWTVHIKSFIDDNKFKNCTVIFTGSHSIDLRKTSEKLSGRRGDVAKLRYQDPDRTLLQAKFSEYVETLDKEISTEVENLKLYASSKRKEILSRLLNGEIPEEIYQLSKYNEELNDLLMKYLTTGGLPKAVDQFVTNQNIDQYTYSTFIRLIKEDLHRWHYNENYAKQLLAAIIEIIPTPISWRNLANRTNISSHKTAFTNVEILGDIFVINYHCKLELDKALPRASNTGQKKIYIRDPFIFHACRGWISGIDAFSLSQEFLKSPINRGNLLECIFSDHLARLVFKLNPSAPDFRPSNHVYYWRSAKDKEVDFLILMGKQYVPIEVKYKDNIKSDDTIGVRRLTKDAHVHDYGFITSKKKLEIGERHIVIPASILLMLI